MENKIEELEYQEEWAYPSGGCLNITDDCNLACHYCFVQQKPHYMDLQTAKDAVDFLWNNYQIKKEKKLPTDAPYINFFGGEPTLLWDEIIEPLVLYIKEKYQNQINIGMTTNGTLLNETRIKFIKNNAIGVLLSIDGDRETQELTRPCKNGQSSFDLIFPNIKLLLEFQPNMTFRATVNQENVGQMFHNYLFAQSLGFKEFFFSPNEREKWSEKNLLILEQEVAKIFQHIFLYLQKNLIPPLSSSLINDGFKNALDICYNINQENIETLKDKPTYQGRCGIGNSNIAIGYNGQIFGCQEQNSRENTNSIFNIGDIYNGINREKQIYLINTYRKSIDMKCENLEICKICKNIKKCNIDMCPSTSMDLFNNLKIKTEVQCRYKNAFTNNALTLIQLLNDSFTFEKYLQTILEGSTQYHGYK